MTERIDAAQARLNRRAKPVTSFVRELPIAASIGGGLVLTGGAAVIAAVAMSGPGPWTGVHAAVTEKHFSLEMRVSNGTSKPAPLAVQLYPSWRHTNGDVSSGHSPLRASEITGCPALQPAPQLSSEPGKSVHATKLDCGSVPPHSTRMVRLGLNVGWIDGNESFKVNLGLPGSRVQYYDNVVK